nr:SLBB domain-containing protein [Pseudomonadota bacterium]
PSDLIEIQVYDVPQLSATERVGLDGKLNLPLIGPQDVAGLTEDELRVLLTREYDQYVKFPKVSIAIKEYQAHRVFVMGAVSKPGVYPLKRKGYLLLEVLSEAGGRTESAGAKITIIPKLAEANPNNNINLKSPEELQAIKQNNPNVIELDLDNSIGSNDNQLMLPLMAGDTVIIADQGTVQVDGEILKPGSYKLSPRTTVSGAIAAAGGLTYSANVNSVELIRDFGAGKKATTSLDLEKIALRGDSDLKLRDGDLIRIPSDSGRFKTRQAVEIINSFFRVGVSSTVK